MVHRSQTREYLVAVIKNTGLFATYTGKGTDAVEFAARFVDRVDLEAGMAATNLDMADLEVHTYTITDLVQPAPVMVEPVDPEEQGEQPPMIEEPPAAPEPPAETPADA